MNHYGRQDKGFWYHQEYDPIRNGSMDGTDITPHDHGLQRALRCHYNSEKDPSVQSNPYKTLFVGRLRPQTTEETIRDVFSRYGPIQSVHLVRDIITGYSKGYAFVEYKHERDFEVAFYKAHRLRLDDSQILVDYMREQTVPGWVPRRLGGGVGGKRPSGQMRFGGRDCAFRAPFNSTLFNKQREVQTGNRERRDENRERRVENRERRVDNRERRDENRERRDDTRNRRDDRYRESTTQYRRDDYYRETTNRDRRDDRHHRNNSRHRSRSRSQHRTRSHSRHRHHSFVC